MCRLVIRVVQIVLEFGWTAQALVPTFTPMGDHMLLEGGALAEGFAALAAAEGLLTRVDHVVTLEIVSRAEWTMTHGAGIDASTAWLTWCCIVAQCRRGGVGAAATAR